MKNISQELCELVGIKTKPLGCTNEYVLDPRKCNGDCDDCIHWDSDEYYIDFEEPENFIKLEEIMLSELAKERLTVVKWVHEYSDKKLMHEYILVTKCGHRIDFKYKNLKINNWFVERKSRVECLILFIIWKVIPICGEQIKQAIINAEWN